MKLRVYAISGEQRYDDVNSGRTFGIIEASKALNLGYKQIPVKLHIITLDILLFVFRVICEDSSEVVSMKTTTNTPTSSSPVNHPLPEQSLLIRQIENTWGKRNAKVIQ